MAGADVTPVAFHDDPYASLADRAYERIRDRLVMLDIRPGEPILDSRLASEFGMGRTPVREALKRLETDHLVVAFPRRGTFATSIDFTQLGSISEIREQLEPFAAKRAAELAQDVDRRHLRALAAEARSPLESSSETIRTDIALLHAVYRAAANPHLEEVLVRYGNLAARIWCSVAQRLPDFTEHLLQHAAVLDAIADGSAERAERLTREHVRDVAADLRRIL